MITRLPERTLDILRSVAVLCVLADHILRIWFQPSSPVPLAQLGTFGVYIFFVHTSLVLMPSIERLRIYGSTRSHWVIAFYGRRAFRIFPLAWVAIAAALFIHIPPYFIYRWNVVSQFTMPGTQQIVGNLLLSQNLVGVHDILTPMWSLAVELQMYLVLPVAFLIARRNLGWLIAIGCAGVALSFVQWHAQLTDWNVPLLWRLTFLAYVPCFMSGTLAYALLYRRIKRGGSQYLPSWIVAPLLAAALTVFIIGWRLGGFAWYWPACLLLALIIPYIAEPSSNMITRCAKQIATYSYGIYLLHPLAIWIAFSTLRTYGPIVQWSSFAFAIVALPVAAYHLIEKPCIQLGHRLLHGPFTLAATTAVP